MVDNLKNKQLFILDSQLLGAILYIVSIVISIILILNQKKRTLTNNEFLTENESQIIDFLNKVFILSVIIYFLYLTYESLNLAKQANQNTKALEIQFLASLISLINGILNLYAASINLNENNEEVLEINEPSI